MNELSLPRIRRNALALTAIGALPCFLLHLVGAGVGILLGGLLATLNFLWIEASVNALVPDAGRRVRLSAVLRTAGRLVLGAAAMYALSFGADASAVGFIAGFLTLLVAIVAESLRADGSAAAEPAGRPV